MSSLSTQHEGGGTQAPPRAGATVGVALAWLVIVATVLFVAGRVWLHSRTASAERAADEVALLMSARYTVGYHELFARVQDDQTQGSLSDAANSFVSSAHGPAEKLRAVMVLGELQGGPAALDELDAIRGSLASPELARDAQTLRILYQRGPSALSPEQRQQLVKGYGWFADLALSYHQPATDPLRRAVMSQSLRAFVSTLAFALVICGAMIAGVILFSLGLARLIDRKLPTAYRRATSSAGPFLEAFAIYLAGYVGIGWAFSHLKHDPVWLAYCVDLAWLAFACCWPLIRGVSWEHLRRGLGWTRGQGIWREMRAGIIGYLAALPVIAGAAVLASLLAKVSGQRPVHPIVFDAGTGLKTVLGLYLLASVWAPIVEETMFRGALFHHLRSRHRWLFSAALSALIFASLHPQGWTAIPILGGMGVAFAGIREWRGTFIASATAHALNNAIATTLLILVVG